MRAGNEGTRRTFKKLIRPKLGGARLLIGSACTDPAPAERSTWATAPSSTSACDIDTSSGCSSTALLYSVMRAAASSPPSSVVARVPPPPPPLPAPAPPPPA
eukprot:COSAG04_NODE_10511_length_772_cov_0.690936_1_plen_101_part_10